MVLSHVCSLMEAALLSITPSQLAELRQKNPRIGQVCQSLKHDIDKPIAVILIVNTAAHTIGAAVAGGAVSATIGSKYMGLFSLAFTLLMVQYTEILPKTLGVRFTYGSTVAPAWVSIAILAGTGVVFYLLAILNMSRKRKK